MELACLNWGDTIANKAGRRQKLAITESKNRTQPESMDDMAHARLLSSLNGADRWAFVLCGVRHETKCIWQAAFAHATPLVSVSS